MIKRFAYIVLLLIFASCLAFGNSIKRSPHRLGFIDHQLFSFQNKTTPNDTLATKKSKQQLEDEKKRVKEIAKAKRQTKPEKIDDRGQIASKAKSKRERRPEGMERPPEIPRRNGN
jgi:hypothetical protein